MQAAQQLQRGLYLSQTWYVEKHSEHPEIRRGCGIWVMWVLQNSRCPPPPQLTVGLTVSVLSAGQTGAAGLAGSCRTAWLGWVPWLRGQTWAVWAAWRAGECCVMLPRPHGDPRECRAGSCCGARSTPSFVSAGAAGLPWGPGAGW